MTSDNSLACTPQSIATNGSKRISTHRVNQSQLFVKSIVQFTSKVTFVSTQDEEFLHVPVVRTGHTQADSDTVLNYETKDMSAKAGKNYVHTEGTLVFSGKDTVQLIKVPQIHNDNWEQALSFAITLKAEGLIGSDLHADLNEILVFQIKHVAWPSKEVEASLHNSVEIAANDSDYRRLHDLSGLPERQKVNIFFHYFKLAMRDAEVRRRAYRRIIVDLLRDFMLFVELLATVYMIDNVINPNIEQADLMKTFLGKKSWDFQQVYLSCMAAFLICDVALFHFLDRILTSKYPLPGLLRLKLQGQVLRQFFHFTSEARERISDGEVIDSMTSNCFEVVSEGILPAVRTPGALGKLVAVIAFKVAASVCLAKPFPLEMLVITLVVFPILPILFMIHGGKKFAKAMLNRDRTFHKVTDSLHSMITRFDIINAYNRRSTFQKEFEGKTKTFNRADVQANTIFLDNDYYLEWVTAALLSFYTILGGLQVASNDIEIGMFMANLEVLKLVGNMWKEMFEIMMTIQRSIPALHNIAEIMNEETDFFQAAAFERSRQIQTASELQKGKTFLEMDILVDDLSSAYQVGVSKMKKSLNLAGKMAIGPGEIVAIVGPSGQGKATLLKILSGVLKPHDFDLKHVKAGMRNKVFVPAHYRILYQDNQASFFPKSLLYNLTVAENHEISKDRVQEIRELIRRLGVSEHVVAKLDDELSYDWDHVLSRGDSNLLNIARAVLQNYELLVLHRPFVGLPKEVAHVAMDVLSEFVTLRGIGQDPHMWGARNPRSCIVTCLRWEAAADQSQQVYFLSGDAGLVAAKKETHCGRLNYTSSFEEVKENVEDKVNLDDDDDYLSSMQSPNRQHEGTCTNAPAIHVFL